VFYRYAYLVWLVVLGCLVSGCTPRVRELPAPSVTYAAPDALQPRLLEPRRLVIDWPETIRQKDVEQITLSIMPDEAGNQPPEGVTDLYQTHNVVATARLDLPGMQVNPAELNEPLLAGRTITFRWKIQASQPGSYRGTLWLHMELVPKAGGAVQEVLVLARPLEVQVVSVFGLPGNAARLAGLAGIGASLILIGLPALRKRFFRRKRRSTSMREE
jgi:hypothetical protein